MAVFSGDVAFCDLIDFSFCISNFLIDTCCKDCCCSWQKRTFIKFLPRILIGATLDLFGILLMMYTTCVYYDGKEYIEGAQNYSFNLDVTELFNYCSLNETQMSNKNLTEVTKHQYYLSAASSWMFLSLIYVVAWMIYYCRVVCKAYSCFTCCADPEFRLEKYFLGVIEYKLAFGALKFLNFAATIIIISKGILLVLYVNPTPLEWFIFVASSIDCLLCIWESIGFIKLCFTVKEIEEIEKSESWKSLISTCTGENNTGNEQNNQDCRATDHQNHSVDPCAALSLANQNQLSEQNYLPVQHMTTEHQNPSVDPRATWSMAQQNQFLEQNNLPGQYMENEHYMYNFNQHYQTYAYLY